MTEVMRAAGNARDWVGQLTDQQLREELLHRGVNAGPVTGTTRSVYENKLRTVAHESNENSVPYVGRKKTAAVEELPESEEFDERAVAIDEDVVTLDEDEDDDEEEVENAQSAREAFQLYSPPADESEGERELSYIMTPAQVQKRRSQMFNASKTESPIAKKLSTNSGGASSLRRALFALAFVVIAVFAYFCTQQLAQGVENANRKL